MGVGYKADYVLSGAYIRRQRDSLSIPKLSCAQGLDTNTRCFDFWGIEQMKLLYIRIYSSLVFVMVAFSLMAQTKGPQYADNSPRGFVEGFYSWYVPRALSQDSTAGWSETLRLMRLDISPQLAKLLEEDSAAQSKCKDLVGLDFDPFLYTQGPAEHYETASIVKTKTAYRANVYRLEAGLKNLTSSLSSRRRMGTGSLLISFTREAAIF
jgi:hypothetical protein